MCLKISDKLEPFCKHTHNTLLIPLLNTDMFIAYVYIFYFHLQGSCITYLLFFLFFFFYSDNKHTFFPIIYSVQNCENRKKNSVRKIIKFNDFPVFPKQPRVYLHPQKITKKINDCIMQTDECGNLIKNVRQFYFVFIYFFGVQRQGVIFMILELILRENT